MKRFGMRIISFMMVLAMVLGLCGNIIPTVKVSAARPTMVVNEEIATIYQEQESHVSQHGYTLLSLSEQNQSAVEEAAKALRQGMAARQETISVELVVSGGDPSEFWHTIWDMAKVHTGNPKEGDSIAWQWGSCSGGISSWSDATGLHLTLRYDVTYYTNAAQEAELDAAVATLLEELNLWNATDYEKVCGIYGYICQNISYDYDNLGDDSYKLKHSAYAALIHKTAVCQGYALLFYRLALELGVDARIITGMGNGGGHAWNIVKLGSSYYNLDATWDAPLYEMGMPYEWFLRGSETFLDHYSGEEYLTEEFLEAYPISQKDYVPAGIVDSGKWGNNLSWKLDSDGVLTISGMGAMPQQAYYQLPWWTLRLDITRVVIEYGITDIIDYAFFEYSALESVSISDSVTSIGFGAFEYCDSLKVITIPNSVTYIDSYAFDSCGSLWHVLYTGTEEEWNAISIMAMNGALTTATRHYNCTGDEIVDGLCTICNPTNSNAIASGICGENVTWVLTEDGVLTISGTGDMYDSEWQSLWQEYSENIVSIVIEPGVTSIGDYAFNDCSALTSVTISDSVTSIGDGAFLGNYQLTNVYISDLGAWCQIDFGYFDANPLYYADQLYLNGELVTEVKIPVGTPVISNYAFCHYENLTSVTIPDSVTTIGNSAFSGCSSLTSVTIPNSVNSIGEYAFNYCTSLTSATIGNGITSIGYYVFAYCSSMASVTIPDGVTSIGDGAFNACSSMASVTIPDSVTSIGDRAFSGCSALTSVMIPDGVTSIGDSAFDDCASLTSVTIPDSVTTIGDYAFWYCEGLTSVTIGNGVTSIGLSAFDYCEGLTSVTIGNSVTTIDDYAFNYCTSLTSVTIPGSVTRIGSSAFYKCTSLTEIIFEGDAPSIWAGAFYEVVATAYYPAGNDTWTSSVMQNYGGTITWVSSEPEKVIIASGTCGDNLTWELSDDGVLTISGTGDMWDYSWGDAPWYANQSSIQTVKLEDGVTSIGNWAFAECAALTCVMIPDSITSIGEDAFYCCTGLTTVTIPDSVTSIGFEAFFQCSGLTSMTIPGGVTSIGKWAFASCTSLTSVTIDYGVTSISDGLFNCCTALASVTIPNSVTTIGDDAFIGCESLTSVTIPNSVTSIGQSAFQYCISLTSVTIPDSVTIIGWSAFQSCTSLTSVTIGNSVTTIGSYAFRYCSSLTSVMIPDSVTSIGDYAFCNCTSLTSVTIPDNVTILGRAAFSGCSALESVVIGNGVTSIDWHAFSECSALTNVTIPDSVTRIGDYVFFACPALTSLTIPDSVSDIGDHVFSGCTGLTEITFEGDAPSIGYEAFYNVVATAYYPAGNDTWTSSVMKDYEGTITWVGYDPCENGHSYVDGACEHCGEADPNAMQMGDANGDGSIDSRDAMLVMQYFVGMNSELNAAAADVNDDGSIDSRDAMLIMQYFVGILESFPAEP